MKENMLVLFVCVVLLPWAICAEELPGRPPLPSETPEPGLSYGSSQSIEPPKTILFSAGPKEIIEDAAAWRDRGVGAFFLDRVAREWSSDLSSTRR